MSWVTLAQLAKMTPEQRATRLHGINPKERERLEQEAMRVLAAIVQEGLREPPK